MSNRHCDIMLQSRSGITVDCDTNCSRFPNTAAWRETMAICLRHALGVAFFGLANLFGGEINAFPGK